VKWREQYERMKRWQARLDEPYEEDARQVDDCYAFFVVCYHLWDWIKNDDSVDEDTRNLAKTFVKQDSTSLRLAWEIAEGFKHLRPKRKVVEAVGAFQSDMVQADAFQVEGIVVVDHGDAREIAGRCIVEWDGFLRQRGMV
jgi:hypothetical protein